MGSTNLPELKKKTVKNIVTRLPAPGRQRRDQEGYLHRDHHRWQTHDAAMKTFESMHVSKSLPSPLRRILREDAIHWLMGQHKCLPLGWDHFGTSPGAENHSNDQWD